MTNMPQDKSSNVKLGVALAASLLFSAFVLPPKALAFDLDLGGLGEIHVRHDAWGHRQWEMNDRNGNVLTGDRSLFGPHHETVHVMGNDVDVQGGAFGNKSYAVNTMTGDNIQGQRSLAGFGHHDNQVDVRGSKRAASHIFGDGQAPKSDANWSDIKQNNAMSQPGAVDRPEAQPINRTPSAERETAGPTTNASPKAEKTLP